MEMIILFTQMTPFKFPDWDTELFLYLNSHKIDAISPAMVLISTYAFWILSFIAIAILIIRSEKYWGIRAAIFVLLGIGMNSLINNLLKIIILRPRPGNNDEIKHLAHLLEETGTSYSFFSAHSSNSFCLAMFCAFYFKNIYLRSFIFAWATTIAYSRIYVGKHYPLDVIVGIMFGLITGYVCYRWYAKYKDKKMTSIN